MCTLQLAFAVAVQHGYVTSHCAPTALRRADAGGYYVYVLNATASLATDARTVCRTVAPSYVDDDNYALSIYLLSAASEQSARYAGPGVMFNVADGENFDFVLFR